MINLKNQKAEATLIPERGGLLTSIKLPDSSGALHELLWTPANLDSNGSSWPGGGLPICFPFAGRVWNRGKIFHYGLGENEYPMPLHGFAYGQCWIVDSTSQNAVHLSLKDNEHTRSIFPFEFAINLEINLNHRDLALTCKVICTKTLLKDQKMPVALGFHPYFNAEMSSQFAIQANHTFAVTPEGGAGKPSPYALKELIASDSMAKSLIFADLRSQEIRLENPSHTVSMSFEPKSVFKHFVIWQNRQDPFWCLEPWMSLPDAVSINQGIQWLNPQESLTCQLKLSLV